jgi:esterase/lipase
MKLKQKVLTDIVKYRLKMLAGLSTERAAQKAFDLFCTPVPTKDLPTPEIFSAATTFRFQSEQETIHGYRWNTGAAVRILLVHGFSSSSKKFSHLIEPLIEKGYEVITFDAPAHGASTGRRINAVSYSNAIRTYFEQYGTVDGIIAHSLGGLASMLVLKDLPDNHKIKTVLLAPATESQTQLDLFVNYFGLSTQVKDKMKELIWQKAQVELHEISITQVIDKVKGPVYWFHDEEDPVTPFPDALKVIDKGYENIRFYPTKGLGHSRIYKENAICSEVLSFLDFSKVTYN